MVRWALGLALMLLAPASIALDVTVDRSPVMAGEAFELTVRKADSGPDPDFAPLQADFQIVNQTESTQFSYVNGKGSSEHKWILTLVPKRVGELTIPALSAGTERSQPLRIQVVQPDLKAGQRPEVFVDMMVEPATAYLRQQVLLTVRLNVAGQLAQGSLSDPTAEGAVIEKIGTQTESQKIFGEKRYRVIERRYALFPENVGSLQIRAPSFSGEIVEDNRRRSIFDTNVARSVYAAGQDQNLQVMPPARDFSGTRWLPAAAVQLSERITPDSTEHRAGDALTRVIELRVDGQLHTQLEIPGAVYPPGVQAYPETPAGESRAGRAGLIGTLTQRVALVPTESGELHLPEIRIPWWDITQQRQRVAIVPARNLHIGHPVATSPPPLSSSVPTAAPPLQTEAGPAARFSIWPWLTGLTTMAWLLTGLAWFLSTRTQGTADDTTDRPHAAMTQRKLLRRLQAGNPQACRSALLEWGRAQFPGENLVGLTDLATLAGSGDLRRELAALDRALYRPKQSWDASGLVRAIRSYRPAKLATDQAPALPALYPESS